VSEYGTSVSRVPLGAGKSKLTEVIC
jgi:hypothetical protein